MKKMKKLPVSRLLRVMVAMMTVFALLLCGCGQAEDEKEQNQTGEVIVLGDGDGKLEAQDVADGVSGLYGQLLEALGGNKTNTSGTGTEMEMTVELGDDLRTLLTQMVFGATEADMDLDWLEEIGMKFTTVYDDDMMQLMLIASLNGEQIISADMIMDLAGSMIYMAVPELNSKYIGGELDMDEMQSALSEMEAMMAQLEGMGDQLPSEEAVNALLTKYVALAVDTLPEPTTEKETLSHGGVSQEVTASAYEIHYMDVLNVFEAVLKSAETDQELEKVLDALSEALTEISGESLDLHAEMMESIPYMLEDLEYEKEHADGDTAVVHFISYTADDKQVGLKLYAEDTAYEAAPDGSEHTATRVAEAESYYYSLLNGENTAFVLSVSDTFRVEGTGTNSSGIANGTYSVIQYSYGEAAELLIVEVEDFDTNALKRGQLKGTLTVSPSDEIQDYMPAMLSDLKVELAMDMNNAQGKLAVKIYTGRTVMLGITFVAKTVENATVKVPSNYVDATDGDAMSLWGEEMDFDRVLSNLKKANLPDELLELLEEAIESGDFGLGSEEAVAQPNW